MSTAQVSATRFVFPSLVLYSFRKEQQLLLFGMLKGLLFYLWLELKYLKLIAIWYHIFYYIVCPIPLLKTTKKPPNSWFSCYADCPRIPHLGFNLDILWTLWKTSDLIKCLDVNPVVYMQLLPFLLGRCSSHLAGSWDFMKQWLFSLCKNNKWEERKIGT